MNRRRFVMTAALASAASTLQANTTAPHIATQVYPWITFYRREGKEWDDHTDVPEVAKTGLTGFEPVGKNPAHIRSLGPLIKENGLGMRSIYVSSILHEADEAEASRTKVLEIAKAANSLGTKIIVTNPSPIKWGGEENKTDAQLREQAKNLDLLGEALAEDGQQLAYHNHDIELREGGREFHHMLTGTDPAKVKFCLDAHWVFRGCGDSQIALFDVVEHYHERIIELHLRQSKDGIWTEAFSMEGDIDYSQLFGKLADWKINPHLVIEQAVEEGTPHTMTSVEAHRIGQKNLAEAL